MTSKNLDDLRKTIDRIDDQMMLLLSERFKVTQLIGNIKATAGMVSTATEREAEQFQRLEALAIQNAVPKTLIKKIFRLIMDEVVANHNRIKDEMDSQGWNN